MLVRSTLRVSKRLAQRQITTASRAGSSKALPLALLAGGAVAVSIAASERFEGTFKPFFSSPIALCIPDGEL